MWEASVFEPTQSGGLTALEIIDFAHDGKIYTQSRTLIKSDNPGNGMTAKRITPERAYLVDNNYNNVNPPPNVKITPWRINLGQK